MPAFQAILLTLLPQPVILQQCIKYDQDNESELNNVILSQCTIPLMVMTLIPGQNDPLATQRQRIDRIALAQEMETRSQESINLAVNLVVLLANQWSLTMHQEADLATKAHERLLAQVRVLPTPERLQSVWNRLVAGLPASQKPREFTFEVYLLDRDEPGCLTLGGGRVYITRGSLERLQKSEGSIAFALAHQLGHICRQDCRRGWQIHQMPSHLKKILLETEERADGGNSTVMDTGRLIYLLHSRQQCYLADLWAWQLCRQTHFPADSVLDALRGMALEQYPALQEKDNNLLKLPGTRSVIEYFLSEEPDPLLRLQRLLKERDGLPDQPEQMGLFHYNPTTARFHRPVQGQFGPEIAPIILIHGLRGDQTTFKDFLAFLAIQEELKARPLLIFRYPENDSLSRSGIFLERELNRWGVHRERTDFICHSAGGLVFRYYAEKRKGAFQRAYFLGTPHHGSELIKLKFLVDLADFARTFSIGLPGAIARSMPSWRTPITGDLHPGSLFLNDLDPRPAEASRYETYSGQVLNLYASLALQLGLPAVKELVKQQIEVQRCGSKDHLLNVLNSLELPDELVLGDGVVSLASASLPGAKRTLPFPLDHLQIKQDEAVMRQVLQSLLAK